MFAHEKLHVYGKVLAFSAAVSAFSAGWDRRHAVVDQLERASESILLNLAEGARFQGGAAKMRALHYSIGSTLECAACLDVARIKTLLGELQTGQQKQRLFEIAKMLVGLRNVWDGWKAREESPPYRAEPSGASGGVLFHHETLDVYAAALALMGWFVRLPLRKDMSCRFYRQIDESLTSIVLNIAEGNGRYSEKDHRRLLDVARGSVVKSAAYLDLAVQQSTLVKEESGVGKDLLERILAMLSRM